MSRATNQAIAAGFSQGLQNFVQGFTERKRKEAEEEKRKQIIERYKNATPSEKTVIAGEIDPQFMIQMELAQEKAQQQQKVMDQIQQTYAHFGINPNQVNQEQPEERINRIQPGFSPDAPNRAAANATQLAFPGNINFMQQQPSSVPMGVPQGTPQRAPSQAQAIPPQINNIAQEAQAQKLREAGSMLNAIKPGAGKGLLDQAKAIENRVLAEKKNQIALEKEANKIERENRKESAPYIQETIDAYKGAREEAAVLGQMKQLVDRGKLITPALNKLMNLAGVPLGVLDNPDVENFDKLSNYLTRGISKYFPGRINVIEFQNFLRQIPTLQNSERGKKVIINNLEKMEELKFLEYNTMAEIIGENGGKVPPNLNFLVLQQMKPKLDQWAKEITSGFNEADSLSGGGASSGMIRMTRNGISYDIPLDKVEGAIKDGFKQ